jgi:hypothetical protein
MMRDKRESGTHGRHMVDVENGKFLERRENGKQEIRILYTENFRIK